MRRIIHNSTAIAVCLSMLAPHVATAQAQLPVTQTQPAAGDAAADLLLAQAGGNPQLTEEQKLKRRQERAARREAGKDGAARPERAEKRRNEPAPKAAKDDTAKDGPGERARKAAEAAEKPARKPEARKAEQEPARRPERKAEDREAGKRDPEQRASQRPGRAEQARDHPSQDRPARRADEAPRRENPPRRDARPSEEDLARRLEQRQREDDERARRDERREEARDDRRRDRAAQVSLATSAVARDRTGTLPGLGSLADREVASGLTEDRLACLSGGVAPCRDGDLYVTPRGVVLERNRNGAYLLAPAAQQIYRVDRDGRVVDRQSGRDARISEAAREAARETRAAANAAALREDRQRRRDIIEQRITDQNRRRSSQDFRYSLNEAWREAERRQRGETRWQEDDDDDRSDLVKALLLGLGAVAVGSMLNNNRQVALSTPDRVVVTRPDGSQEVIKDEVALLRQPGSTVTTEEFDDGSSRTIVTRPDGSKVVTIRDADLRILRRTLVSPDGRTTQLIDDTAEVAPVDVATLPAPAPLTEYGAGMDEAALRAALARESGVDRRFTLGQIRNISEVRSLVAPVDIEAITFDTGSSAISPDQASRLSGLGAVIADAVAANPREMFLIEGHTDTVGPDPMNLALSDRRAESVALALTEYFDVPPENLVVQGYGEQDLKIRADGDIRDNRRASVRRITDLLRTAELQ
ncbi:OmpA family protein [Paracoccus spongiarum]|uniref:OmpA family protein n=1 Tax=Paracoccus spongiarum TaxID=3064387 RepID=A0ABT9JE90_9RHOB|nr:OmpA family protein [Paracoccus sp. 2205BS29-5]MDP5308030.1 OmpA family protein [Paracoccus sp. 2205BS29-5]